LATLTKKNSQRRHKENGKLKVFKQSAVKVPLHVAGSLATAGVVGHYVHKIINNIRRARQTQNVQLSCIITARKNPKKTSSVDKKELTAEAQKGFFKGAHSGKNLKLAWQVLGGIVRTYLA